MSLRGPEALGDTYKKLGGSVMVNHAPLKTCLPRVRRGGRAEAASLRPLMRSRGTWTDAENVESGKGSPLSLLHFIPSLLRFLSVVVRHSSHVVGRWSLPPQRRHLRIIGGSEIPDDDAHRSIAQQPPSRIVIRC